MCSSDLGGLEALVALVVDAEHFGDVVDDDCGLVHHSSSARRPSSLPKTALPIICVLHFLYLNINSHNDFDLTFL